MNICISLVCPLKSNCKTHIGDAECNDTDTYKVYALWSNQCELYIPIRPTEDELRSQIEREQEDLIEQRQENRKQLFG